MSDLNYVEDSAGGPDVTVGILVKMDQVDSSGGKNFCIMIESLLVENICV